MDYRCNDTYIALDQALGKDRHKGVLFLRTRQPQLLARRDRHFGFIFFWLGFLFLTNTLSSLFTTDFNVAMGKRNVFWMV